MAFHEIVDAGEAAKFEGYGREIRDIQKERPGKPDRVMHKKQHLGAMGEFVVKAAEGGRFGVFATEQTWPVYVRFSNGFGVQQPDKVTDVRGFAMKLVGVPGKKIPSRKAPPPTFTYTIPPENLSIGPAVLSGDSGSGIFSQQSYESCLPRVVAVGDALTTGMDGQPASTLGVRVGPFADFLRAGAETAARFGGYEKPKWADD